jgi:transposase InsO family protein
VRFAWIRRHAPAAGWPVAVACDVLDVSRSGYYAWRDRPASVRARRRVRLAVEVKAAHAQSRGTYGSPRVHAELKARGVACCENTVAKVMRAEGVRSKVARKFRVRTTDANHAHPVADNLLDRDFAAAAPDRKWAADVTYVPTAEGWLFVAAVIDLCTRKVVGWAMASHLRAQLCLDALAMALARRHPAPDAATTAAGLVHHSDRGCQYACGDYRAALESRGIACSMSRPGDCYDNAVIESFWGTLKRELVHHEDYATREQARSSIFEWIECWYNRKRRHSALDYKSPEEYEASLN